MAVEVNVSLPSCSDSQFSFGQSESQCRICHNNEPEGLISPCCCSGSMKYVHEKCLGKWIYTSNITNCEVCKFQFITHTTFKPFWQWEPLKCTCTGEWRTLIFNIAWFTFLAIVVWVAVYSFRSRTDEEVRAIVQITPLWLRRTFAPILALTWITACVFFKYKLYLAFFCKWRVLNRVIHIQNAPQNEMKRQVQQPTIEGSSSGGTVTETGIDLTEVCSSFLDEDRVCAQNDDRESLKSEEAAQETSWMRKSGKAESLPSQRFNENEPKGTAEDGITYSREDPGKEVKCLSSRKNISVNKKCDDDNRDPIVMKRNPSKAHFQIKYTKIDEEDNLTEDGFNNYQQAYSEYHSDFPSHSSLLSDENGSYTGHA